MGDDLERAVGVLGPLEGRVMRAVWTGTVGELFVVRDVAAVFPTLAYTTVMTTLRRLADKGLLVMTPRSGSKGHVYQANGGPAEFLAQASRREATAVIARYGTAALAAFAGELQALTPRQRQQLEELR